MFYDKRAWVYWRQKLLRIKKKLNFILFKYIIEEMGCLKLARGVFYTVVHGRRGVPEKLYVEKSQVNRGRQAEVNLVFLRHTISQVHRDTHVQLYCTLSWTIWYM